MTIYAGEDQKLYRPLDNKGNYTQGAVGCHRGHMEVLNVRNPKPGFRYYYIRTDPSSVRRAQQRGWQPVSKTDPERMGEEEQADLVAAGLDTTLTRNDIVLCRMPEERYRTWRAQMNQRSEGMQGDGSADYMEKGRPLQEIYGKDVYFKAPGHGLRHSEH